MQLIKTAAIVAAICTMLSCKNGTTTNTPDSSGERNDVNETSTPLNGGASAPQNNNGPNSQTNGNAAAQNHAGVGYDSATDSKTGGGSTGRTMADTPHGRR